MFGVVLKKFRIVMTTCQRIGSSLTKVGKHREQCGRGCVFLGSVARSWATAKENIGSLSKAKVQEGLSCN